MTNTKRTIDVDSFHLYLKDYPNDIIFEDDLPLGNLEYQFEPSREIYYSVFNPADRLSLIEQLNQGVPLHYECLLHFIDRDFELVKLLVQRNNFVHDFVESLNLPF